jgi:phytoene dehydrogenase-like protein
MQADYDVIVIGAGVGGLAAAGLLAHAGRRVLVLERHAVVGGCCSTFRRAHFIFDAAVHAIGGCRSDDIIGSWMETLNVEQAIEFIPLEPFYTVRIGQEALAVPASLDELGVLLRSLAPQEAAGIARFIETVKILGQGLLDQSVPTPVSLRHMELLSQIVRMSWLAFLEAHFSSRRLLTLMTALCVYAGLDASSVSALFMASVLYSYHRGAYYPRGSTQRFADTLALAVRQHGGEILRRATVSRILVDAAGVRGARFIHKRELYEVYAPVIISNADAYKTLGELIEPEWLPKGLLRRVQGLERSVSALCLYLAVDGRRLALDAHETFYLPSWNPLTAERFYYQPTAASAELPGMALCIPTLTDRSLAPAEHHVVSLVALARATEVEALRDRHGKSFIETRLLQYAETLLPGVTRQIRYKELATPRTVERYTNNSAGAIYGWAKSVQQWPLKLGPATPLKGLFLAGHWTGGGHGVYGAFRSGVTAARAVLNGERGGSARERSEEQSR